jgi:shikimate 5-dehydrogenase
MAGGLPIRPIRMWSILPVAIEFECERKRAAVIGCGGAGRAIAAALVESGAGVTLDQSWRGTRRTCRGVAWLAVHSLARLRCRRVMTSSSMRRPSGATLMKRRSKLETINDDAVVIDLVYGSRPTPLVGTTRARNNRHRRPRRAGNASEPPVPPDDRQRDVDS